MLHFLNPFIGIVEGNTLNTSSCLFGHLCISDDAGTSLQPSAFFKQRLSAFYVFYICVGFLGYMKMIDRNTVYEQQQKSSSDLIKS